MENSTLKTQIHTVDYKNHTVDFVNHCVDYKNNSVDLRFLCAVFNFFLHTHYVFKALCVYAVCLLYN